MWIHVRVKVTYVLLGWTSYFWFLCQRSSMNEDPWCTCVTSGYRAGCMEQSVDWFIEQLK